MYTFSFLLVFSVKLINTISWLYVIGRVYTDLNVYISDRDRFMLQKVKHAVPYVRGSPH